MAIHGIHQGFMGFSRQEYWSGFMGFSRQEYLSGLPIPSPYSQPLLPFKKKDYIFETNSIYIYIYIYIYI